MATGRQLAPPLREMCRAQENRGLSIRLATASSRPSRGLRTSVGELCDLMSARSSAPEFTGRLPSTRLASG
jgi:hypothetical protein